MSMGNKFIEMYIDTATAQMDLMEQMDLDAKKKTFEHFMDFCKSLNLYFQYDYEEPAETVLD